MNKPYTKHYESLSGEITTPAYIFPKFEEGTLPPLKFYTENAAWDTGAECSIISPYLAQSLNLKSIGKVEARGVGHGRGELCEIAVALPNGKVIHDLQVYCLDIEDYDILLGMDVINQCDFAITNQNGKTTFSFQSPSSTTIDFSES